MDELRKVETLALFMELNERLGVKRVDTDGEFMFGFARGNQRLTAYSSVADRVWKRVWTQTGGTWKRVDG